MKTIHIPFYLLLFALPVLFGSGCAILRKGAAQAVAPMAAGLSAGLMHEDDLELVREGSPAFLLMLDALAAAQPDNSDVQLAASEAQFAYATGFVAAENPARAKAMLAKAKRFGLRALTLRNPHLEAALAKNSPEAFADALRHFRKQDARALVSTGTAWVMWIIASSDSPAAIGELSRVLAVMDRARELDPGIRDGAVDLFYGVYFTVLPLGGGRDLEKAKACFEAAIAAAGPDYLLNRVTFAEFYARYAFDRDLFEQTLREVLAATPQRPENTLMNAMAQQRAQSLLDRADDLF